MHFVGHFSGVGMAESEQTDGPAVAEEVFSYQQLHKSDRVWLRRTAASLRVRLRRNVRDTIENGQALLRAHRRLGRSWRQWLRAEDLAVRTATRLIAVHNVFGALPPQVLEKFTPSALHALVGTDVPRSLREFAVEAAQDGQHKLITRGLVEEWAQAYRTAGSDPAPISLATNDEAAAQLDDARRHHAENWALLDGLIGLNGAVHLTASTDTDNGLRTISGTVLPDTGKARYADGSALGEVVLSLAGETRSKRCRTCHERRKLEQFSKRKDSSDGRNSRCLYCERARVKSYSASQKKSGTSAA
jgi:hypothetical protein